MGDSHVVGREQCPKCGSRDNLARYSDGHAHCFGMGCGYREASSDEPQAPRKAARVSDFTPIPGTAQALLRRHITEETCRHFGYLVGTDPKTGKVVQLAPYRNAAGEVVAQKVRDADKNFCVVGKLKEALPLFGQHLWGEGGRKVVITEGEIDCLTVSQLQGNKWPVVSVPNGATGAAKSIRAALEWLEKFDEVILMFDQDDPGRAAAAECAALFSPGKCKVAMLPLKDPNEMLKAGRGAEVIKAMWDAKPYRPDGIRSLDDVAEAAALDIERGLPWFLPTLDELTYGRRPGEVHTFGAGTGVGKTDLFTQSIAHDLTVLGIPVGVIYLEQPVVETVRRIAGKVAGKVLHVPGLVTVEERKAAIAELQKHPHLHLYDSFGVADWETLKAKIRFMAVSLGCKVVYLDHLTALAAGAEDERVALEKIMAELAALALELGVWVGLISHLSTPEGKPHEEGGRVMVRHFKGSRAIGFWSHFMYGLERNQQAEDEAERQTTVLRILKDRNTGQSTGKVVLLGYDRETGRLFEQEQAASSQFPDSPTTNPDF
jgi:twinkle protein